MELAVGRKGAADRDHLRIEGERRVISGRDMRAATRRLTATMAIRRELGSWILKANEMSRMATGVKA